jgi:hypothetical protein
MPTTQTHWDARWYWARMAIICCTASAGTAGCGAVSTGSAIQLPLANEEAGGWMKRPLSSGGAESESGCTEPEKEGEQVIPEARVPGRQRGARWAAAGRACL